MSLVLSRRVGESLMFYIRGMAPITVKVDRLNKFGDVRLVIDAPLAVNIVRDELLGQMSDSKSRKAGGRRDADNAN